MRGQEIKHINIKDLVLWTENPRDPIDENASDQDIVDKALGNNSSKWNLDKLAKEMGDYYDYSELPTVVFQNGKYVVYDGNRRIILGKIKHGLVNVDATNLVTPDFPASIPCNVCPRDIAIENVYRKHAESGTWKPLERDIFSHKYRGDKKSIFLILEENTGIITANPHLNQRYVRDEIFKEDILSDIGFTFKGDKIYSNHSASEAKTILDDISKNIHDKVVTTREQRGKIVNVLAPETTSIIQNNKNNKSRPLRVTFLDSKEKIDPKKRKTKRTNKSDFVLFGEPLYLKSGSVSDLYRDISDMYNFYVQNKSKLSSSFSSLIRMSLRLLCETAAKDISDKGKALDTAEYVNSYFKMAKDGLNQDKKTTLSLQNVKENTLMQLLHVGAHNYSASKDIIQTIAVSIAVGAMVSITHGRSQKS